MAKALWLRPAGVLLALVSGVALAQAPAEAPAAPRFDIQRFVVDGNTILPQDEVDRIVAPFAGAGRDFGDVQRALEALQDAYLDRGYSASRVLVPEQDLKAGVVRLQVVEARTRNVRVEGNRFFDEANVRASLPSLVPGEPPNTRRIGENIQLANENPAKKARVVLEPTDEQGKVDAVVNVVDDKPTRTTVFLDNTGNSQTGYYRAGVGYQNTNLFNRDHVLTAQVVTSPTQISDVTIFGVGYRVPVYQVERRVRRLRRLFERQLRHGGGPVQRKRQRLDLRRSLHPDPAAPGGVRAEAGARLGLPRLSQ